MDGYVKTSRPKAKRHLFIDTSTCIASDHVEILDRCAGLTTPFDRPNGAITAHMMNRYSRFKAKKQARISTSQSAGLGRESNLISCSPRKKNIDVVLRWKVFMQS
ncbi:hypothetical protein CCACVL1_02554 [Corchorus capsularis]|uniref:Uncharacterized protein n=1 Tax=Corchorus capsularis TaxID=210143 RepID=A0A1R3K7S9_COCAP|nr:hypothetical protein CCACVL1_02554 [Corchorus capsularis]